MKKINLFLLCVIMYSCTSAQVLVKEINPGPFGSDPQNFVALGDLTLFIATDKAHGFELWRTDGTESNTVMIVDSYPGPLGGLAVDGPHDFELTPIVVMGNKAYFFAIDSVSGYELWSSDGTTAGTSMVKDIVPGSESGLPLLESRSIFSTGKEVYFSATDGTHGMELWKSDGTANGTVMVKEINPSGSSNPSAFFADGPFVYFKADDGVHGSELWKSDGTPLGTTLVADINKGAAGSEIQPFKKFNNEIYFSADDGVNGQELWKTDGTTAGTKLIKDITPGAGGSLPHDYVILNNHLFFIRYPGNGLSELWSSDGTPAGTIPLKSSAIDFSSYSTTLTLFNGKIFFPATDGINGMELWISDGTTAGTSLFYDINKSVTNSSNSNPNNLIVANGNLYFSANDGVNGFELWKTDGTPSGTAMLNQICPGACHGLPQQIFQNKNTLFFGGNSPDRELYKLDLQVTSVTALTEENQLLVYPNPFSNQIQISGTEANGEFILYDLLGKEITRQKAVPMETIIHTGNLLPGVYMLRYLNGTKTAENRMICKGQ